MLKELFSKITPGNIDKKNYDFGSSYFLSNGGNFVFSEGSSEYIKYYFQSSPVFTAIKLITDNLASIKPVIFDNKKNEYVYEHPLLTLLQKPNPFSDGDLFIKSLASYYLLTGNCYVNIVGSSKPLELYSFNPQDINIVSNTKDGYPQSYQYCAPSGSATYNRDRNQNFVITSGSQAGNQIGHLKNFNPKYSKDNLYGVSELVACELEISQYLAASIHNNSLLKNQARPSGLLIRKGQNIVSQESIDSIKNLVKENLSGAANAGQTIFLNGDFDWKQLSESIKDMDFATLKSQTEQSIYKALKVPLTFATESASTMNNKEIAKLDLYDNTVIPLAKILYSFLGNLLLPRYAGSEELILTYDESDIDALKSRQVDNTLKLSQSGVLTINEIRTKLGYESLEGGDNIYQPASLASIASDLFTEDNRNKPNDEKARFIEVMMRQKDLKGNRLYSDQEIKESIEEYYGDS